MSSSEFNEINVYTEDFLDMMKHSLSKLLPEDLQKKVLASVMMEMEATASSGGFTKEEWSKNSTEELITEVMGLTEE